MLFILLKLEFKFEMQSINLIDYFQVNFRKYKLIVQYPISPNPCINIYVNTWIIYFNFKGRNLLIIIIIIIALILYHKKKPLTFIKMKCLNYFCKTSLVYF
jgi:uncharacterized membrane protein